MLLNPLFRFFPPNIKATSCFHGIFFLSKRPTKAKSGFSDSKKQYSFHKLNHSFLLKYYFKLLHKNQIYLVACSKRVSWAADGFASISYSYMERKYEKQNPVSWKTITFISKQRCNLNFIKLHSHRRLKCYVNLWYGEWNTIYLITAVSHIRELR